MPSARRRCGPQSLRLQTAPGIVAVSKWCEEMTKKTPKRAAGLGDLNVRRFLRSDVLHSCTGAETDREDTKRKAWRSRFWLICCPAVWWPDVAQVPCTVWPSVSSPLHWRPWPLPLRGQKEVRLITPPDTQWVHTKTPRHINISNRDDQCMHGGQMKSRFISLARDSVSELENTPPILRNAQYSLSYAVWSWIFYLPRIMTPALGISRGLMTSRI